MRTYSLVRLAPFVGVLAAVGCHEAPAGPRAPAAPARSAALVTTVSTPSGGWRITEVDLPYWSGCGPQAEATSINSAGWIVGTGVRRVDTGCARHAFLLRPGGALVDLTPRAFDAGALAISDAGVVVGYADGRAFRWSATQGLQFLAGGSSANALTTRGEIVGTHGGFAVMWTLTGQVRSRAPMTAAYAIDALGRMAGSAPVGAGPPHAVIRMDGGAFVDLGTRGAGAEARGWWGPDRLPFGNYYDDLSSQFTGHAFTRLSDGTLQLIPTLGGRGNVALGGSFSGAIVGWSWTLEELEGSVIDAFY